MKRNLIATLAAAAVLAAPLVAKAEPGTDAGLQPKSKYSVSTQRSVEQEKAAQTERHAARAARALPDAFAPGQAAY